MEECNEEQCKQPSCAPGPLSILFDRAASAVALVWLGAVWLAELHVGIGLLGVAVIIFAGQLFRVVRELKPKPFWIGLGLSFAVVGVVSLTDVEIPAPPFLLILGGVALLLSLLVRGGLLEARDAGRPSYGKTH